MREQRCPSNCMNNSAAAAASKFPPGRSRKLCRMSVACAAAFFIVFLALPAASAASTYTLARRYTADELGVPECHSNYDCVIGGVCVKDYTGKGRCFCSSSCPLNVPVQCVENNQVSCITMGEQYTSKYEMRGPMCYHKRCICPPLYDPVPVQPPIPGFPNYLPRICDRRQLEAQITASPSDALYKGTAAHLFCCINVDPRGFIPSDGIYFVQNGTRKHEPNTTPYENFSSDIDTLFTVPKCWGLDINNVHLSDAGTYMCIVQPINAKYHTVNVTMEFGVKKLRRKQKENVNDQTQAQTQTETVCV